MVLVTGATGLVGAHLVLQLAEQNQSVRALYRSDAGVHKTRNLFALYKKETFFDKIEWLKADILDVSALEIAFEGIQYVYHCAALISFDPKDESLLRKTNIEGTANIVNFSLSNNIQKLCYISSIAALGDLKENENTINEETEWNPEKPHSDYAITKYGAEMEIWRAQQEGLSTIIVNPGLILGAGFFNQGSGLLFSKIKKGLKFYTKGSTGVIAVTDVTSICQKLMQSSVENERFIVVAENISYKKLFDLIANALHSERPKVCLSVFWMAVFWRIDWLMATFFGKQRMLDKATALAANTVVNYDNSKIKNTFEFSFQDTTSYINTIVTL